jgi:AcrR family transcriptional regulator
MNRDSAKRAPAPRLRARLREATTEAIREAAEAVFVEQGFGARMEDIAERAGVSVGTLYNHFEDRDALLLELVRLRREALMARVDAVLAEVEGRPFREQLQALLDKVFSHFREHARFFAMVMQSEVLRGPGNSTRAGSLPELTKRVEQLIQRGVASGELRREGSELYATLLMGMVRGLLLRAAELKRSDEIGRGADVLLQVFLRGIEVQSP